MATVVAVRYIFRMRPSAHLALLVMFWPICAMATDRNCSVPELATRQSRSQHITQYTSEFVSKIGEIEAVPPSEAEYLDKESKDALRSGNRQRYRLVYARPFFQANQLRKSLRSFETALRSINSSQSIHEQATNLISSLGYLAETRESFHSYLDFDNQRSPPVLNKDNVNTIWFLFPVARATLEDALRCAIGELKEP